MRRAALSLTFILVLLAPFRGDLRAGNAAPVFAQKTGSMWERKYPTGDWGGLREQFAERGIVFNFTYAAGPIGVVSGGIQRGMLYNGLLDLGATPGIRLRAEVFEGFAIQAAVFDGNVAPGLVPDPSPNAAVSTEFNRHGTHWALRPDEGALIVGELSYRLNQVPEEELSATRTSADARPLGSPGEPIAPTRGLAGSYEFGFLYHTDEFAGIYDVTLTDLGSSLAPSQASNRGANYAIYANLEQELWREAGSEARWHSNSVPDFEATIELVYRYQIAPWLWVQPHAQYVIHPGGTKDYDNALIIGVRTNIAF